MSLTERLSLEHFVWVRLVCVSVSVTFQYFLHDCAVEGLRTHLESTKMPSDVCRRTKCEKD